MASETEFLVPIIILLGTTIVISVILPLLKVKFLPSFVIEILIGIFFSLFWSKIFIKNNEIIDIIYVIGFSIIMFISGYDIDFSFLKDKEKTSATHLNISRISIGLLLCTLVVSVGISLFFMRYYEDKLLGILLLTVLFTSTFAGAVVPLIHVERIDRTGIGNVVVYYSILNEFITIVLLTLIMLVCKINDHKIIAYLVLAGIFLLTYILVKIIKKYGKKYTEGTRHLVDRLIIVALCGCVVLSEIAGGEYILGAFLFGSFTKAIKVDSKYIKNITSIGFALFVPMFFIIVGTKINFRMFIEDPKWFLTVLILFGGFVFAKLPLLYLLKWYKLKPVVLSLILTSSTLVVGLTVKEIGTTLNVFPEMFGESLILASVVSCIIPPAIYEGNLFSFMKNIKKEEKGITYGKDD